MIVSGAGLLIVGAILAIFGFFIGVEVPDPARLFTGGRTRVMHLPSGLAGGVLFLAGIILIAAGSAQQRPQDAKATANPNDAKWRALVEYDADIAAAAKTVRSWGAAYEAKLADAYFALEDKAYLPAILKKLEAEHVANEAHSNSAHALTKAIDTVYVVHDQMRVALLKDGRAIGWIDGEYKIFDSVFDYRSKVNDFFESSAYVDRTDEDTKIAFLQAIPSLHAALAA